MSESQMNSSDGNSPEQRYRPSGRQQAGAVSERLLSFDGTYRCPICRYGEISGLTLMDAFACNFCRHIFTANLPEQKVQVVDSVQPMSWRWTGQRWRVATQADLDLTVIVWLIVVILVLVPAGGMWLAAYTFPPLPDSPGAWVPSVWISATLAVHSLIALWLLVEHYQVPFYVAARVRLQTWWSDRQAQSDR